MIFIQILVFVVTSISFKNAAIFIQAPKYVPKQELLNLVQKYYRVLEDHQNFNPNEGIEIEVPIPLNLRRQYQPMVSMTFQQDKDTQYPTQNDILKKAEDAILNTQSKEKELDANKVNIESPSTSAPDLKNPAIYQEDVLKALDELKESLKVGGNRPATVEDLRTLVNELEKRILQKHEEIEKNTTTSSPCNEERIMQEALKPVLEEDVKHMINLKLSPAVDMPPKTDVETPRPIEIIILQKPPKKRPYIGQKIMGLFDDDITRQKSWAQNKPYVPIVRIPSSNSYGRK